MSALVSSDEVRQFKCLSIPDALHEILSSCAMLPYAPYLLGSSHLLPSSYSTFCLEAWWIDWYATNSNVASLDVNTVWPREWTPF